MSSPDPSKVLFSSRYRYFLNKDSSSGSVTLPATSIAAGRVVSFSLNVPIDNADDYTQIKMNFSHDSSNWYLFPCFDVTLDANFTISVTGSYSGSALTMTFIVVNQTGSTHTSTATTVTVSALLFEPPN